MSVNTLGMIIIACLILLCIGMALWSNRPAIRSWLDHHHWHWPHFR